MRGGPRARRLWRAAAKTGVRSRVSLLALLLRGGLARNAHAMPRVRATVKVRREFWAKMRVKKT